MAVDARSAAMSKRAAAPPAGRIAVPPGLVAVGAIAVAGAALIKFDLTGRAFVGALFAATLVVLSAIDLEHRLIPNRIVLPAAIVVLLGDIAAQPSHAKQWAIAAFAALAGGIALSIVTRGGVGMGDAKLGFLLGAGLGYHVVGGLVLSMAATFVVAVAILVRHGIQARKETIPFGPFLALGALIALFLS